MKSPLILRRNVGGKEKGYLKKRKNPPFPPFVKGEKQYPPCSPFDKGGKEKGDLEK